MTMARKKNTETTTPKPTKAEKQAKLAADPLVDIAHVERDVKRAATTRESQNATLEQARVQVQIERLEEKKAKLREDHKKAIGEVDKELTPLEKERSKLAHIVADKAVIERRDVLEIVEWREDRIVFEEPGKDGKRSGKPVPGLEPITPIPAERRQRSFAIAPEGPKVAAEEERDGAVEDDDDDPIGGDDDDDPGEEAVH